MFNQRKLYFKNFNIAKHEQHPFHLVAPSILPLVVSWFLFTLALFLVHWFYVSKVTVWFLLLFFLLFLFVLSRWFASIFKESYSGGYHTHKVQSGLYFGMVLFIISEIMFFFSLFWAYFHCALSPSVMIGGVWPPQGIAHIPFLLPVCNTLALLSSGVAVTYVHKIVTIKTADHHHHQTRYGILWGLGVAIVYAIIFIYIQFYEYKTLTFSINDGIYGSLFFMLTGFHGFHVIIGTIFLSVMFIRAFRHKFRVSYVGLECAIWYWHFVDVVWLFLWVILYANCFPLQLEPLVFWIFMNVIIPIILPIILLIIGCNIF